MDANKIREQFEKRIHQPAGSYWCEKDRTYRYEDYDMASSQIHECQWQAWIAAWQASREAAVVELPKPDGSFENHEYLIDRELSVKAIEAQGLKVEVKP
ncbi:hypothetical protein IRZ70_11600 [Pseudomonas monteilii]|nr:hypothetical protein [Pseudomonas monteilii]